MIKLKREGLNIRYYSNSPMELKKLEAALRFYVPGAEYSPSYREHKWDGYFRFYDSKRRSFKYGLLHLALAQLEKYKIEYTIENDFERLRIKSGLKLHPVLWQHQREAILKILVHRYGTIEIPTRGGKTLMAAELMRLLDFETVLFVVDGQMLFQQAIKDISEHLQISRKQIGEIRGDVFELKPITVAMIQTLQSIKYGVKRLRKRNEKAPRSLEELKQQRKERRVRQRMLEHYMQTVDLLFVDEIHEYSSDERIGVIHVCQNVRGVVCLSATPEKSSSIIDNIKIKSLGGPIIYRVDPRVLKARGVLAQETIVLIIIDHRKNKNVSFREQDNYDTYEERLIVNNERRNNIITNILQILRTLNIKTLALFKYIKHGKNIQSITGDELLTNEVELNRRLVVKNQFLKRKAGTLLATNIFNKGITLPEVEVLVNAGAGKEQSLIIQKKGRTLGTTKVKKKAITVDLIDISDYFSEHSASRIQVYEDEIGLENIMIFDSSDPDFYQDLREFFDNWKNID